MRHSPCSIQAPRPAGCIGTYLQDEWRITNQLTLNAGLRFDQMYQYVDANQLSPRVSLTWKPYDGTTFHAGYARNFTPPPQVIAAPTNLALVTPPTAPANTQTPAVTLNDPVLPERSNVFDVGVVQKIYRDTRPRSRHRRLLQDRARPARRRPVRRGLCAERLQLRPRRKYRPRAQVDLHQRQFPRLWKRCLGQADRHQRRVEPVFVRSRRTRLYRQPLYLHRPCPDLDRVGRRLLPVERHALSAPR